MLFMLYLPSSNCSEPGKECVESLLDAQGSFYGGSGGLEGGGTVGLRRRRGTARRSTAERGGGGARVAVAAV